MSNEEDRQLFQDFGPRAWDTYGKDEQKKHLQRKIDTTCVEQLSKWMEMGVEPQPESFLNHGLEQKIEIMFKVIESSPIKFRTKSFEVFTLMRSCLANCSDFSFIDDLNPSLAVKNLIGNFGAFVKSN